MQDKATRNLFKSLSKEKDISQLLALSRSPFLAKNDCILLIYSDMIDVMCVTFIGVQTADKSHGGKKRWGSKSEVTGTILGMQGEMAVTERCVGLQDCCQLLLGNLFEQNEFDLVSELGGNSVHVCVCACMEEGGYVGEVAGSTQGR